MTALAAPQSKSRVLAELADRVFLWVPNAATPGAGAFLISLVRQCTLPFLLIGAVLLALSPITRTLGPSSPIALVIGLGSFVIFEELARYSFVRRAARPVRAIMLFTVLTILVETATYFNPRAGILWNIITRAPSWGVHVGAGVALYWAVTHRRHLLAVLVGLMVAHTAFNVGSVELFGNRLAASDGHADQQQAIRPILEPNAKLRR